VRANIAIYSNSELRYYVQIGWLVGWLGFEEDFIKQAVDELMRLVVVSCRVTKLLG